MVLVFLLIKTNSFNNQLICETMITEGKVGKLRSLPLIYMEGGGKKKKKKGNRREGSIWR